MKTIPDLDYAGDGKDFHRLDVYLPDSENFDTVIYIHGGGLDYGSRKDFNPEYFVNKGTAAVSVDYRLLPEADFPEFIEDTAKAIAYVKSNLTKWKGNGRIFLWGASAGAYIVMMLCLNEEYIKSAGLEKNDVTGYISESAQQFAHFNLLKYRGFDSRIERIDETAPISFVKEGLEINPLLMIYYSEDIYCRPEENKLMYKSMKRFLPENSVLDIVRIEGTHCRPTDKKHLFDALSEFVTKVNKR